MQTFEATINGNELATLELPEEFLSGKVQIIVHRVIEEKKDTKPIEVTPELKALELAMQKNAKKKKHL